MHRRLCLLVSALPCFVYASSQALSNRPPIFDYVIIGGGTAGLAVATRLSEDPHITVAVIEAGVHYTDEALVDTPEMFGQAIGNPAFDWNFYTVPQPGLKNLPLLYPRGKMLGGSSGLNFMAWDRASVREYDAWEKLGAKGWNWKTMLPYFKKTEAVSPQTSTQLFPGSEEVTESLFNAYHGRSGPVQASYNVFYSNITAPYVETVNALGIPTNSDPYMGDGTGVYNSEMNIDRVKYRGKRSYAANTYYDISVNRPNLKVFVGTQAIKVNFVPHSVGTMRATSVTVTAVNHTGITGIMHARKEVVLAAGSIQTPQLLELSGIGNKTVLQSVGIKTLIDLPGVGENLQDHTLLSQDFEVLDTLLTYDKLRNDPTYLAEQEAMYKTNGTGIFASAQFALMFPPAKSIVSKEVLASLQTNAAKLVHAPGLSPLTRKQYEMQADWLASDDVAYLEYIMCATGGRTALTPNPESAYITLWSAMMHPFSRGAVHISSSDPLRHPAIDPRYLDNDFDTQMALESAKFARKITESQPLASYVIAPHEPSRNLTTDDEWLEYVRTFIGTVYHPVGTAAMLPREVGGVVDPSTLKVYGTANLRVVDASVFPMIIATHPVATIYAIAERAADMIKGLV